MRVLNIEDDTFKHNDICKALSGCGIKDVEWSNNFADGWKQIKNSIDSNNPYDLIITDMYYPNEPGGREEQSGDVLIDRVIKNKISNTRKYMAVFIIAGKETGRQICRSL